MKSLTQNINNSNIYCVTGILQEKVMQANVQSLTCNSVKDPTCSSSCPRYNNENAFEIVKGHHLYNK